MKLMEGRIGRQELSGLVGISLVVDGVFTMDSARAYAGGNSTYLWLPLAAAVAFGVFWLLACAMQRAGQSDISAMADFCFGKRAGGIVVYILVAALVLNAFFVLSRLLSIVYSFIFAGSKYWPIVLWIMAPVAMLAFMGLESVGRVAKCLAVLLGALLLAAYVLPLTEAKTYRLYPLLGDGAASILKHTFTNTYKLAPALVATLGSSGMHGLKNTKKSVLIGCCVAIFICFVTQFVLGLMYTHGELVEMYFPLYRLNMPLLSEGYYFRLDKILLLLWLAGATIAAGYHVYMAALLFAKRSGGRDTRPVALSVCVSLLCVLLLEHIRFYPLIQQAMLWVESYAFIVVLAPLVALAATGWIKCARKGKVGNEAA